MTHTIPVRKIPFNFSVNVPAVWHPKQREWSHMVNGASLAMPYLEPFLNRTMREALAHVSDPDLRQDIDGFIRQEAQHYGNHRRYNEGLKAKGYPELADVEATFEADYTALQKSSLEKRLAYCAGFETMTMGITEWLIEERDELFKGADPTVTSLVLWHMVEETEHKSVAFDVFQAVSGHYWLRVAGLLHGSLHVGLMSRRAYKVMLKKDGQWRNVQSRLRLWKMVARFFHKAGFAMLQALRPGYHPDKVGDPAWIAQWRHAYAGHGADFVPLLNTSGKTIRPEFE
jgi:predicted metal-dependent hydrolase